MANRSRPSSRRSRPNNNWFALRATDFTTIPAASKVLLATAVQSNPGITETVLRVLGAFAIESDQAVAREEQIGAVGLMVVTDTAAAAGVASIPGPSTDANDDGWFAHQFFMQNSFLTNEAPNSFIYPFNSKGRRVMEEGSLIAIVVENAHATHGLNIAWQFRMLTRITGT